jgi:CRISPR-associated protein Cas2
MDIVVAYDIATPDPAGQRRLARVAAVCERYGSRIQYSVFECRLDGVLYERLITDLLAEIDPSTDTVNLYRLGSPFDSARQTLGHHPTTWDRPWVL